MEYPAYRGKARLARDQKGSEGSDEIELPPSVECFYEYYEYFVLQGSAHSGQSGVNLCA